MIKNKTRIEEDRVIKKKNKDLKELYDYFEIVNFDNYIKIIDEKENYYETRYIENKKYHEITPGLELIKTLSILHNKTLHYKDISKNKYKTIFDKLNNHLNFLEEYFINIVEQIEEEEFMSPSHYLFIRNYSVIDSSIKYAKKELKKWFKLVENKTQERVCVIHNNIKTEHFIKGDKNYLISFDNYMVDTPILDLYKFYKTEGYKLNYNLLFKKYNENLELLKEEKLLHNILISIPPKIEKVDDELNNTINIKNTLNYIYKTLSVISENNV